MRASQSSQTGGSEAKQMFNVAMLNMAWQLAIAVLLPIWLGHLADVKTGKGPLFALIGLVVGVVASVLILRRAIQSLNSAISMSLSQTNDKEKDESNDQ